MRALPKPMKVLMVDDNIEHLSLCSEYLPKDEFILDKALNAAEAMKKIGENGYDLIILDYSLPDIDGLELLKKIKSRGVNVPIIFTTAFDDPRISFEAMKNGVEDYVVKTFEYYKTLRERIIDVFRSD
ncbi:MAG: response regulator [Methanomassiliicoccales archaeon]